MPSTEWVSIATAAELAGCSPSTMQRYVTAGLVRSRPRHGPRPSVDAASARALPDRLRLETEQRFEERQARDAEGAARWRPPNDGQVWLDTTTTALILGVTTARIHQRARAGTIPTLERGGRRWFLRDHIEQLAAAKALHATRS